MNVKNTHEEIENKKQEILELNKVRESNTLKMVKIYRDFLSKLNIISFISGSYYFSHPKIQEVSSRGPILGKHENYLFVYDLNDGFVKKINIFNLKNDPDKLSLHSYFSEFETDFEVAMQGIISLIDYQDRQIETLRNRNEKTEERLEKFSSILEEFE